MLDDAFFNFYHYYFKTEGRANGEQEGYFGGNPAKEYGNTIVRSLFKENNQQIETEAILVLNVWMAVAHELYETWRQCRLHNDVNASMIALDAAAALWIGSDQTFGSNEDGHSLYRLAEIAGERFGQDTGESRVNTLIVETLNSIQTNLSTGLDCTEESKSMIIRDEIFNILNLMTIPLVQNLIHHALTVDNTANMDFVYLYSAAVMPHILTCDPNLVNNLYPGSIGLMDGEQKRNWVGTLESAYSCFRLSCAHIGHHESGASPECFVRSIEISSFAGYVPSDPSAKALSFIDRDILQLEVLLQSRAYVAATDLYQHGYNSVYSLQDMALNQLIPNVPHSAFDLFESYYESNSYKFADSEIMKAMHSEQEFEGSSVDQISEIVVGLVKFEVIYLSLLSALKFSVQECWLKNGASEKYWDMGAAFFIGSIEGTPTGGMSGGQLLFGTSKKLCHSFGTCEDDQIQNAKVNTEILNALSNGKASILSEDCQSAQQYLDDAIISSLLVPLIQGALVYGAAVSDLDVDSADGSLGTAYAFSRGILPFVNQARAESSAIIDRNLRYPHRETSDISQVSEAFRLALPVMNVSCFKVGVLESAVAQNLCPEEHYSQPIKTSSKNITNPEPANIDDIAFGRYNFSSSETSLQFLSLALDIRDMIKAPTVNDAKAIYENGLNAIHTSYSRETTPITLRSFSTDAVSFMSQDPMFNIFKYALYDDKSFDNSDEAAFPYADEVVQEALLAGDAKLAAEAVVALNVWMMVAHKLYNVVRTCKNRGNAKMQVDEAVALWIGLEQSEANSSDGWLLYSLAQRAALDFGLDQAEAAVNTQLFLQFNELQSLSEQCFEDPAIHLELRIRVNEVIRSLSIPLLQHLLISIASDDQWHVELYSAGVISQSAACSPKVHSGLSNVLYTGFSQDRVNDEFFDNLAVFLRCMRVSCHDLHHSENADPKLQSLVSGICERLEGQTQQSQWLELEQARIDLDILQVGIFMRTKAYEAASDYYQNGLNSFAPHGLEAGVYKNATLLSLRGLATLPERVKIDEIDTFSQYYGSSTYADDIVMHCIQRTGIFHNASTSELAAIATRTLQTMVSFIAVLWQFELAIQICKKESDEVEATDFWNSGIAFFLGSIDGYAPEQPSSAGFLLHSLGMELCSKFGTCSDDGESNANEALFGYFEEAKHLLTDKKCDEVQNLLASDILPLLHVPTIQGVLFTSIPNNTMSNDVSSEGYVFSQSILPLLHEANAESGQAIANIFNSTLRHIMDSDDTEVVFQAIKDALPSMNIDCKQVGNAVARPDFPLCVEFHKLPQYAEHSANIGIDVAEMTKALLDNRKDLAQMIYTDGKNSYESRAKILQGVKTRSLQSLSTVASTDMLSEPLFNIFLYSYSNGKDGANFEESLAYADKFVQEMFRATTSESSKTLAAEAAVVLNVWMYFSHMLHEALESCKNNEQHEGNFTQTIDEAAAYWIGDAKIGMLKSSGHLLYGLADNMDGYFDHDETFSSVNDQVLALLAKAKRMLLQRNACAPDSDTLADLHATVNEIIAQAKVPLVQGLIHSLRTDDRDRVKLYSHALVPLIAVCNPTEYDFFQAELLKAEYDVANIDAVVERIYGVLPCLGLRCSEVGVHLSETFNKNIRSECTNPSPTIPVEGYPASDTFHEVRISLFFSIYL